MSCARRFASSAYKNNIQTLTLLRMCSELSDICRVGNKKCIHFDKLKARHGLLNRLSHPWAIKSACVPSHHPKIYLGLIDNHLFHNQSRDFRFREKRFPKNIIIPKIS